MITATHPPLRPEGSSTRLSLAVQREDERAIIDLPYDDFEEDFDGWLIDEALEESGIIVPDWDGE